MKEFLIEKIQVSQSEFIQKKLDITNTILHLFQGWTTYFKKIPWSVRFKSEDQIALVSLPTLCYMEIGSLGWNPISITDGLAKFAVTTLIRLLNIEPWPQPRTRRGIPATTDHPQDNSTSLQSPPLWQPPTWHPQYFWIKYATFYCSIYTVVNNS